MSTRDLIRRLLPLAVAGLGLAACGPMPVDRAEAQCAQMLRPVYGEAKIGVNQDGAVYDLDMTVQATTMMSGDPAERYNRCVYNRSGQFPTRPFYSLAN